MAPHWGPRVGSSGNPRKGGGGMEREGRGRRSKRGGRLIECGYGVGMGYCQRGIGAPVKYRNTPASCFIRRVAPTLTPTIGGGGGPPPGRPSPRSRPLDSMRR